jgi:hypothetical protein
MKQTVTILLLLCALTLSAVQLSHLPSDGSVAITGDFTLSSITSRQGSTHLSIQDARTSGQPGEAELPVYSHLVALPASGNFTLQSQRYDYEEYDLQAPLHLVGAEDGIAARDGYSSTDAWLPREIVSISEPNIMRGIRFAQVAVHPVQYNPAQGKIRVLKNLDIQLQVDASRSANSLQRSIPLSADFADFAASSITGLDATRSNARGNYVFICPPSVAATLQPLLAWKRQLGFTTHLVTTDETGTQNTSILAWLQNAYNTWDVPPEYVVLVGDVNGSYIIPTFYKPATLPPGDMNETDHGYTLLDGTDYFPDLAIGRLSFQSLMQLQTIVSKIIHYESEPDASSNWTEQALMLSVVQNYYNSYTSGRETVMAVREKLLDYEYATVDTFIEPYNSNHSQLMNYINAGKGFVNYRGFGAPNYWSGGYGYMMEISDINNLSNGFKLPMVTSIVCGGGDFGDPFYDSCFGETWLNAGSPACPKGAIGFIGPSEHDTKTWFNNAMDMGIYHGITQYDITRCYEMMLAGKMELYNCYPNGHAWGNSHVSDQFYFYTYNLLGDPGLSVWIKTPRASNFITESQLTTGANFIEVQMEALVGDPEGFTIAVTTADSLWAVGYTDASGHAIIPVNLASESYTVTASKAGHIPASQTVDVTIGNALQLISSEVDNAVPGGNQWISFELKNIGSQTADNLTVELTSDDDYCTVTSDPVNLGSLAAGQTTSGSFSTSLGLPWREGDVLIPMMQTSSSLGTQELAITMEVESPELAFEELVIESTSGYVQQLLATAIKCKLHNTGSQPTGPFVAELFCDNGLLTIQQGQSDFTSITPNNSGQNETSFQITAVDAFDGQTAHCHLVLKQDDVEVQTVSFDIPIGQISEDAPTYSQYGYCGIESNDSGNLLAPDYNWVEISPQAGGSGTAITGGHGTNDGRTATVNLPFTFTYFGKNYTTISVSTNGWIAMGETDLVLHRNRNIPSGVGPAAMIAPFWDALTQGTMYMWHDAANHRFIIEWYDFRNPNFSLQTFQAILYDPAWHYSPTGDGDILFQYQTIMNNDTNDNYCTVGIENETQTDGVLITFANLRPDTAHLLQPDTAILFTTRYTSQVNGGSATPTPQYSLSNYPNPFNPNTTIAWSLAADGPVKLDIYNVKGRRVTTLVDEPMQAGTHRIQWNGTDAEGNPAASGIYFYRLQSKTYDATRKMILLQ